MSVLLRDWQLWREAATLVESLRRAAHSFSHLHPSYSLKEVTKAALSMKVQLNLQLGSSHDLMQSFGDLEAQCPDEAETYLLKLKYLAQKESCSDEVCETVYKLTTCSNFHFTHLLALFRDFCLQQGGNSSRDQLLQSVIIEYFVTNR